uniref:UPF0057-domain-containing protein n=1 Tax=Rhabditophanes sp. KR3021 TaxID=114890 RepID=A0AC35UF71_9BILA
MVNGCCANLCLFVIFLIFPPFAVLCEKGCDGEFWINVCLYLLGVIPGYIHAAWVLWCQQPQTVYVSYQ